jgi:hypothetical protein
MFKLRKTGARVVFGVVGAVALYLAYRGASQKVCLPCWGPVEHLDRSKPIWSVHSLDSMVFMGDSATQTLP